MARITRVNALVLEAALPQAWDFGIEPYQVSTCVVVEAESDSGHRGYGEAIARKSPLTTATLITDLLAPIAVGRDVAHVGRIWVEGVNALRRWGHHRGFLLEAVSGLDVALWDLRARVAGLPMAHFLPGGGREEVETYASSIYFQASVEDAAALGERLAGDGHRRIKIKVGHRPEQGGVRRDIATVRAIREAVGDDVELMLDANGAYTLASARRVVEALRELDIIWLEEPFPPDDLGGYRALAAISPIPLAAGESEFSVFGFRDLITSGSIGFAQPDIARCGGFTGSVQVTSLCYAHHVPVCPHTGFSAGLNNLASIHLAAGLLEGGLLEWMIIDNPLQALFTEPLPSPVGSRIPTVTGPGLGLEVDAGRLADLERAG